MAVIKTSHYLLSCSLAFSSDTVVDFREEIVIENDGNAVVAATFPTTLSGNDVHQFLIIENGCRTRKSPLVDTITVTLNDDVIFSEAEVEEAKRIEIALSPAGEENQIVVTASGTPQSSAVITFASSLLIQRLGGRSVLAAANDLTTLAVHNAGAVPLAYRIVFYLSNGNEAGRTEPISLQPHAADVVELADASGSLPWTEGPVQIIWASVGQTRVSATASHSADINGETVPKIREVELDDFGTTPINKALFDEITGGLLIAVSPSGALQETTQMESRIVPMTKPE